MNKKGEVNIGSLIIIIMGIIVCMAFLGQIFTSQAQMTTKNNAVDEIVDISSGAFPGGASQFNVSVNLGPIANVPTGWKATECPLTAITVTNATGSALTVTTDYTLNTVTGVLNVKNTTATQLGFKVNNNSLIDYTYCLDGYNTNGGSRSIAGLIGLFTVLALVAFVIGMGVKEWIQNN